MNNDVMWKLGVSGGNGDHKKSWGKDLHDDIRGFMSTRESRTPQSCKSLSMRGLAKLRHSTKALTRGPQASLQNPELNRPVCSVPLQQQKTGKMECERQRTQKTSLLQGRSVTQ